MSSPDATRVQPFLFPPRLTPCYTQHALLFFSCSLPVHIIPSTAADHQCLLLLITVRELGMHSHPQGRSTVLTEIRWSPPEAKAKDGRKEESIVAHLYLRAST